MRASAVPRPLSWASLPLPCLSQAGKEKHQSKVGLSHYLSCLYDSNVLRDDLKGSEISSGTSAMSSLELVTLR